MMKRLWQKAVLVLGTACILAFSVPNAQAQSFSFIRDAEIEDLMRDWSRPIFQAAGLQPRNIEIYLVKDKSLNAFVAGGQRMFLFTGFLQRTDNPGQVKGVIAHETGHIAGGHLSRARGAMAKARTPALIGALLGIGAAIGGRPDVGAVVAAGGQTTGLKSFLAYSRTQEGAADQSAVRYLTDTQQSAMGLVEFLRKIEDQELLVPQRQDPYMRSHPVTSERIARLVTMVEASPFANEPPSAEDDLRHRRMVAKLRAFIDPIGRTLRHYKKQPNTVEARYALAIAHFRRPDLDQALPLIDGLIVDFPEDPYFWELKGQMLRENGRVAEALGPYQRAVDLKPDSALLRANLAQVQLNSEDPALLDSAIANLDFALAQEKNSPFYWRQLAIAWGRKGDQTRSSLALAEEALLTNKPKEAVFHANRAANALPSGSPERLQAEDILNQAQADLERKRAEEQ